MPAPLHLFDSESLDNIIMNACRPIPEAHRDAFLHAVADVLKTGGNIVGPGSLHRAIRALQRVYFDPPLGSDEGDEPPHPRRRSNGKYAR
jgi:hypothetical protein